MAAVDNGTAVEVADRVMVDFRGAGHGVAPLSWGQRELWGGMAQQGSWFPIGLAQPVPPGTTVDDVAAGLRYLIGRHQSMRTRLRFDPEGPRQVVAESGELPVEIFDAGDGEDPAVLAARVERRYRDTDYDFTAEWPLRVAVIRQAGRPTHQVTIMCHLVTDGFGAAAMLRDLADRDPATGGARRPPPAMQPLAQARWQRSPAGQRQNAAALRYWEGLLRTIPIRRFAGSTDPRRPRYWQATLDSPALRLAAGTIAARTGADTSTVLLTAFAVALVRVTGIHPAVVRVIVSNRFRPGLADVVGPISQPGLCVLDVAGCTVDEAVARTRRRTTAAYKYAHYDTDRLDELIYRVGDERGEDLDIACFFNDRRSPAAREIPDCRPAPGQLAAARSRTAFRWGARMDRPTERLFLHVEDVPDTVAVSMWADTHHLAPADIEAFLRHLEETAAAAALDPAASTGVSRTRESP